MNPDQQVYIVKCGARTPVGTCAGMSADMVRIGLSRIMEHPYFIDDAGEPVTAGLASYLDEWAEYIERCIEMALPALHEVLTPLDNCNTTRKTIPAIIGLPSERPGLPEEFSQKINNAISDELKSTDHDFTVKTITNGHSSGLIALEKAFRMIRQNTADICLIGGIESYIEPETFRWLEDSNRLLCTGNKFGFIPGEAAGFCLIASQNITNHFDLPKLAHILSVNTALENKTIATDSVCIGEGLTKVFRSTLQKLPINVKIDQVFCDLNGERYRTDEYGFAGLRMVEKFYDYSNFCAPANIWGDIGAASGPLLINLAIDSVPDGHSRKVYNLIWTSSDFGERCAVLLELDPKDMAT